MSSQNDELTEIDVLIISKTKDFIRMSVDEHSKPQKVPRDKVTILTNVNNYARIRLPEGIAIAYELV